MQPHATTPYSLVRSLTLHRELIGRLVRREFEQRFRGSYLGMAWAVLTPLITAAMFTFVFSAVFAARWGGDRTGPFDFAMLLMLGMAIHGIFAEVLSRAPTLMLANAGYVTKVVFPLEVLPVVGVLGALVNAGISATIVLVLQLVLNGSFAATAAFLPLVLAPYLMFVLALALLLAAIGVYLRDLSQLVTMLVTATLFLSPIFYPVDAVPEPYRQWMHYNPLTFIIEQARAVTLIGIAPDFRGLAVYAAGSASLLAVSFWLFQRLRVGFADVL